MKIALASDLHLEFEDLDLQNDFAADVLILAGDILIAEDLHDHPSPAIPYSNEEIKHIGSRQYKAMQYREFIKRCSARFPHVIVIAGNHEFYNGKWHASIDYLYEEYSKYPNVHFLECDKFELDDVIFIGGTLWTDINKGDPLSLHVMQHVMNDFSLIRDDVRGYTKLRPAKTLSRHKKTMEYFKGEIKKHSDKKIVVVSHMAPSSLSIHSRYANSNHNYAYYSDLSEFILDHPQIKLWCCGHVHHNHRYYIGSTLVSCNPRGYVHHERGSQEQDPYYVKIIDLDNMPSIDVVDNDYDWTQH